MRKSYDRILDQLGHRAYQSMIIFTMAFIFFSVVVVVFAAFSSNSTATFPPTGLSLRWFDAFLSTSSLVNGFKVSLALVLVVVPLTLAIAVSTSYAVVRYKFKGREQLNTFFLSPLIVPAVATGAGLSFFLRSTLEFRITFVSLVILHLLMTLPYALRTVSASLAGFDMTLEEAAKTLGASGLESFIRITLPSIKAGLVASAIFTFAASMDEVTASLFVARSDASPLPVELLNVLRSSITPVIASASVFLIIGTFVITYILDRYIGLEEFMGIRIY